MSLVVETTTGQPVLTRFVGMNPITGVQIGEHEMSLESFSAMAFHFLRGGFLGWKDGQAPEPVGKVLTELTEQYELRDDVWIRKSITA